MNIRKATMDDENGIAKALLTGYNMDSAKEAKTAFREEVAKKHNFIVAEDDGRIIGLTTWQMHGLPKHELAELDRIVVMPEYRGKNVAEKLFDFLLKDASEFYKSKGYKLRKLYLLTHASNARAQAFYRRLGMEHETILKNHFYDGEDEFVFSIFLK